MIPASIQIEQTLSCENEQEWSGPSNHGQNATPCGAPGAKFYEWFDGIACEGFLCDCCAEEMGLL